MDINHLPLTGVIMDPNLVADQKANLSLVKNRIVNLCRERDQVHQMSMMACVLLLLSGPGLLTPLTLHHLVNVETTYREKMGC